MGQPIKKAKEKRAFPRKSMDVAAAVTLEDGRSVARCTISDASPVGCRIRLNEIDRLPDTVRIVVMSKHIDRTLEGKVVWRKNGEAGVKFQWEEAAREKIARQQRQDREIRGMISDGAGTMRFRCRANHISVGGCIVTCEKILRLPEDVSLLLDTMSKPFNAKIVWRQENVAGIQFVRTWPDWVKSPQEKSFARPRPR